MPAARSASSRWLAALLLGAAVLYLWGLDWGLPNTHSWNGDDLSPEKPLRVVWAYLFGWHKYPYLHWWLNAALYAPVLAWLGAAGQVDLGCFPRFEAECFADPETAFSVFMVLSRLLSVAMALGIVWATVRLARRLGLSDPAALLAGAACATAPGIVFFAHTGNLDVPHTFWFTLSLLALHRVLERDAAVDYVIFGLLVGCAVATKEGIVGAYLLPVLGLGVRALVRARRRGALAGPGDLARALLDRRFLWLAGASLGVYVLVQNPVFNLAGFERHLAAWLPGGERMEGFRGGFRGWGRLGRDAMWQLAEAQGAAWALAGAGGLALGLARRHRACWLLLPALSYLLFSIGAARFVPVRFFVPLAPIVAVFAGVLVDALLRTPRIPRALAWLLIALPLGHGIALALHLDGFLVNDARYRAEAELAATLAPGARVVTYAPPRYLPRLERLGYEVVRLEDGARSEAALVAAEADAVVLSERYYPRFRGAEARFFDDLKAGSLGHRVAYEGRYVAPLEPWLGGPSLIGAINPRIFVLVAPPAADR